MGEEAYNAAVTTFHQWGLFLKLVADQLGKERAMELHEDAAATIGSGYEAMINDQYPDGLDLKSFGETGVEGLNAKGWTSELIMDDDNKMTIKMTKCPRYDGFKMAGLSDELIKEHCMRQVRVVESFMQKADSRISFAVPLWDAPNGRCDEVFKLK
jgi:hypothetical protein